MSLADRHVHEAFEQFQKPGHEIRITRMLSTHLRDTDEHGDSDETPAATPSA